ncbi:MAG TPA: Hsp20/alpha crystallin family protein [Gammaproteobacteria bacterium]|nr:Hsp20/alpha crystallin family protein [Gammaproteobacteria bacterium]
MYRVSIHPGRAASARPAGLEDVRWQPPVDVIAETGRYVLRADLPGVDPAGVEITMEDGVLRIAGERESATAGDDVRRTRRERVAGCFARSFRLPDDADPEAVSASSRHGVLEITVPRRERSRRIEVEAA